MKRKMIPFEVESFRKPHLGENTEKLSMKERCNKTKFKEGEGRSERRGEH